MLAMLLHRLVSTVYLNRAYIYCFADRAYIRYRTGITIVISVQKRRDVHSYIIPCNIMHHWYMISFPGSKGYI